MSRLQRVTSAAGTLSDNYIFFYRIDVTEENVETSYVCAKTLLNRLTLRRGKCKDGDIFLGFGLIPAGRRLLSQTSELTDRHLRSSAARCVCFYHVHHLSLAC